VLRHYEASWGTQRVLLVGYSFGAGILPFAVRRLPAALRAHVIQISLLGLEPNAPFQISVAGWLGADRGRPVLPELHALDLARVQCFYGLEEKQTLCTAPGLAGAERIAMPGGHHFGGDYSRLARDILAGAARRSSRAPGPGQPRPRPRAARPPGRTPRGARAAAGQGVRGRGVFPRVRRGTPRARLRTTGRIAGAERLLRSRVCFRPPLEDSCPRVSFEPPAGQAAPGAAPRAPIDGPPLASRPWGWGAERPTSQ
jgi:hypothetical protein